MTWPDAIDFTWVIILYGWTVFHLTQPWKLLQRDEEIDE